MSDIASEGRTVLFVSHDIGAVASLCQRGILLEGGKVKLNAPIQDVIDEYMGYNSTLEGSVKQYSDAKEQTIDGMVAFQRIELIDGNAAPINSFYVDQKAGIRVHFEVREEGAFPLPNLHLLDHKGDQVLLSIDSCNRETFSKKGFYSAIVWIPSNFLNNGIFTVGMAISTLDPVIVHAADYSAITIEVMDKLNTEIRNGYAGKIKGMIRPKLEWNNKTMNV